MRANRLSGSEGGAGANPLFLPLSIAKMGRMAGRFVDPSWFHYPALGGFALRLLTTF